MQIWCKYRDIATSRNAHNSIKYSELQIHCVSPYDPGELSIVLLLKYTKMYENIV